MEQGPDLSILEDLERELQDVAHALQRLADATYGRCEACGGAISEARLEALPSTRLCCDDHRA